MSRTLKIRRALVAPGVSDELECIMNVLMYYECLTGGPWLPATAPKTVLNSSVGALGRPSVAHMALLGRLGSVLGDLGAIAVDLGSNLVDLVSE